MYLAHSIVIFSFLDSDSRIQFLSLSNNQILHEIFTERTSRFSDSAWFNYNNKENLALANGKRILVYDCDRIGIGRFGKSLLLASQVTSLESAYGGAVSLFSTDLSGDSLGWDFRCPSRSALRIKNSLQQQVTLVTDCSYPLLVVKLQKGSLSLYDIRRPDKIISVKQGNLLHCAESILWTGTRLVTGGQDGKLVNWNLNHSTFFEASYLTMTPYSITKLRGSPTNTLIQHGSPNRIMDFSAMSFSHNRATWYLPRAYHSAIDYSMLTRPQDVGGGPWNGFMFMAGTGAISLLPLLELTQQAFGQREMKNFETTRLDSKNGVRSNRLSFPGEQQVALRLANLPRFSRAGGSLAHLDAISLTGSDSKPLMRKRVKSRSATQQFILNRNDIHVPRTSLCIFLSATTHMSFLVSIQSLPQAPVERAARRGDIQIVARRDLTKLEGGLFRRSVVSLCVLKRVLYDL